MPSSKKGRHSKRGRCGLAIGEPPTKAVIWQTYERLAASYFEQNGYEIIQRNWRAGHREIDLVVRKSNLIAFVEVKSALSKKFGHPVERVDDRKIANLTKAAQQYLIENKIENCDLRFDVVTFINGKLEHFPDAFPAAD